ncbi:MAG TPA: DedA family protein [Thermodesulfobacteriota bacterium]|nr:DedA family protein [Thermodesulfobacteriota bacterium]
MEETSLLTQQFPYLGIFILLILGGIGLPFPEDATLLLSGVLLSQDVIRPVPAILVVYFGLLLTDFFLYMVGRKYGRRVVEHKKFHKIISPENLLKIEEKFKVWGSWVIFLGRHVIGIRAQLFLVSGVMRIPAIKFLIVDAVSALFTIGIWGGIGYWGGNSIPVWVKGLKRVEHIAGVVVLGLVALGAIFWFFKVNRKFKDR